MQREAGHLSHSAVPRRAQHTRRCSCPPGQCTDPHSGRGWNHTRSLLERRTARVIRSHCQARSGLPLDPAYMCPDQQMWLRASLVISVPGDLNWPLPPNISPAQVMDLLALDLFSSSCYLYPGSSGGLVLEHVLCQVLYREQGAVPLNRRQERTDGCKQ